MDGSITTPRQARLLAKLAARTNRDGTPKRNYAENVAQIRAELAMFEEITHGNP